MLDLGSDRLSLRRLWRLLDQLPRHSRYAYAIHGPAATWGPTEHLLAEVVDLLNLRLWQAAGRKNAPKPKPLQRPGLQPKGVRRFGTARMTLDQAKAFVDRILGRKEG